MPYYFRKDLIKKDENHILVERKRFTLALNESFESAFKLFNEEEKEKILSSPINRYPTSEYLTEFLENIKKYCNLKDTNQILIGNGIDELLYFLFISINHKNPKCLINVPAYPDYKNYGESVGISFIEIPLIEISSSDSKIEDDFKLDIKKIISVGKRKDVKAIIFTNPNNPTGTIFNVSDIIYIIERLPEKLIIIDEAYIEFCKEKTLVPLINEFPNIIILRTFSKGFLSPGLRLAYILSNSSIIRELKKVFPVFPVSQISIEIGKRLLEKQERLSEIRDNIAKNREKIYLKLLEYKSNGLLNKVYKTSTNFVLFQFYDLNIMNSFYNFLLENNLSIRNVCSKYLRNSLRVTSSNDIETDKFIELIAKFFEKR